MFDSKYLLKYHGKNLNINGTFDQNTNPVSIDIINICTVDVLQLVRVKMFGKYMSVRPFGDNSISFTDDTDDSTIFYIKDMNICKDNYVLSVGECMSKDGGLLYFKQIISRGIYHEPLKLSYPSDLYEKLLADGIVCFKLSESKMDIINKTRESLHNSPHQRISNLFDNETSYTSELLDDSNIIMLLRKIFDNKFHLSTYSSNTLTKDNNDIYWHTDYPYHNLQEPYDLTRILGIQVNITIDEITPDNGSTLFVKGSHQYRTFPKISPTNYECLTVPSGTVIMYFSSLWHSSGINKTDKKRSLLLANFSPLDIPAKDKFNSVFSPFSIIDNLVCYKQ
jgi:hypothetical protein